MEIELVKRDRLREFGGLQNYSVVIAVVEKWLYTVVKTYTVSQHTEWIVFEKFNQDVQGIQDGTQTDQGIYLCYKRIVY